MRAMSSTAYIFRRATEIGCASPMLRALLLTVCVSNQSLAQVPPARPGGAPTPPPTLTTPTISINDAVTVTLGNNAEVKRSQQDLASSAGRLQETRGAFDWNAIVTPSFNYSNVALAPDVRNNQRDRRLQFQAVSLAFGIVNRNLLDTIATLGARPPRCPVSFASANDVANGADPLSLKLNIRGFENTRFSLPSGFRDSLRDFKLSSPCAPAGSLSPNSSLIANLWGSIAGTGANEAVVTLTQTPEQLLKLNQQIAEAVSARSKLALDRLGVIPLDEVVTTAQLDASLSKPLRNGLIAGVHLNLRSNADNFKHKSLDLNFGGLGTPILFNSSAFATLLVPLSRNRGAVSVAAPERAAGLTLTAQTDRLRHTASEQALRTILAYLNLVGAQENVRSLEESVTRQGRIEQLTRQLITTGDISQIELSRAQARGAAVATSLSQSRTAVTNARLSLAEAMGVNVESLAHAPLAAETFATSLATIPDVASLTSTAMASRSDARALTSLRNAARVLQEGANADARPLLDLELKGGMATFFDDPAFFILPDEANPIFTQLPQQGPPQATTGAVRFASPTGFYRSMFDRPWKPLFTANLTLEIPWGNNTRRGRAAQATASLQSATVQERDLVRVIRENLVDEVAGLQVRADAIKLRQAAADASQQTVDAVIGRFQISDQTLIDTLLAEESLTQDRLALVRLWQDYLSQLARLRFESGTLLGFTGTGLTPDEIRMDLNEFVRR
jgi:outer membrane protein